MDEIGWFYFIFKFKTNCGLFFFPLFSCPFGSEWAGNPWGTRQIIWVTDVGVLKNGPGAHPLWTSWPNKNLSLFAGNMIHVPATIFVGWQKMLGQYHNVSYSNKLISFVLVCGKILSYHQLKEEFKRTLKSWYQTTSNQTWPYISISMNFRNKRKCICQTM